MNNTSQHIFEEIQPPLLQKIMKINQPQDDINLQFWDHLICAFETIVNTKSISYLFYKGKTGNIVLIHFQQQCLMLQKSFKLVYGIQKQITCIKCFDLGQNYNQLIKQNEKHSEKSVSQVNAILCVGYQDGTIQIFYFSHKDSLMFLKKVILLKSLNNVSEPITNIIMHDKDMYVAKPHFISLYKEIKKEIIKKICGSDKQDLTCTQTNIKFKQIMESTKVFFHVNINLHIYTQALGLYSFSLPTITKIGSLVDQIKSFYQTQEEDWIIGSCEDNIKIIYKDSNQIQRFTGLKNFPSCIQVLKNKQFLQLFVCDMNGELHYFKKRKKQSQKSNSQSEEKELIIFDQKLKKGVKISQFGIKKAIILQKMMIIQDIQQNITIFDIISQEYLSTNRTKTFSEVQT